jgi:hypothetical protein
VKRAKVRATLEAHTPWAYANFERQALWLACSCGWNTGRDRERDDTWNEHFIAATRPKPWQHRAK